MAAVYFITAKGGLSLSPVSGFATLVWPPTGIALAALFLFGKRLWPGVFLAASLVNLVTGAPLLVALDIGAGNTLEPVVGAYLLKRFGFQSELSRIKDVILLLVFAALFSTLISATIGTSSLLFGGTIKLSAYPSTWDAWWVGDMLGDLIIASLLLVWFQNYKVKLQAKKLLEGAILAALFIGIVIVIFGPIFTKTPTIHNDPYLLFPLLIWATLRFRTRLVITLNLLLVALTVIAAIHNFGPFTAKTINERLFSSQLFIGVTAVTFLSFSAAISERRKAQTETYRLNHELEKALIRRTTELMKEKEIEKLKDEFVAVASHELKTPITIIKAYAGILDKNLRLSKDKKMAIAASSINRQADKLTRFVAELLDVSRIESGNLDLHESKFDLTALIKMIISEFQNTSQTHRVIDEVKKLPYFTGDQNFIEQVMLNLLNNAVKYSPKADKVIVKSSVNRRTITISVQDFGSGIPKKDLTQIFKRFYRTTDRNKRKQAVSGIGLGLYIASEIIRQHGGTIWAESKLGRGSTISFSLPVK